MDTDDFKINSKQVCYEDAPYPSPCLPQHEHDESEVNPDDSYFSRRTHNHDSVYSSDPHNHPLTIHSHDLSSQTLKKNIKPFKDFNKALDDIIQTPLFTYQYKDKDFYPEKKRMGIISEKLPEHLQIKDKNRPSKPDWMSVYGSFWAGIKALYNKLNFLRKEIFSKVDLLKKEILSKVDLLRKEILSNKAINSKRFEGLRTNQEELKKEFIRMREELKATKRELERIKKALSKKTKNME